MEREKMKFSSIITDICRKDKIKYKTLSEKTGIHYNQVLGYCNGKNVPSYDIAIRLLEATGVSMMIFKDKQIILEEDPKKED